MSGDVVERFSINFPMMRTYVDQDGPFVRHADHLAALQSRATEIERLREALLVFTRHYEPWMDKHGDDVEVSTFSRHTFGDLRAARTLTNGGENGR